MKNGFTLIELLVVVGIIGLLLLIVIPSTIKIMDSSINNTMKIQENEIEDAAKLYLEDYCKTPIDDTKVCTLNKSLVDGIVSYNGEININILIENEYIGEVTLRDKTCIGRVIFTDSVPKVFLKCEDLYTSEGY